MHNVGSFIILYGGTRRIVEITTTTPPIARVAHLGLRLDMSYTVVVDSILTSLQDARYGRLTLIPSLRAASNSAIVIYRVTQVCRPFLLRFYCNIYNRRALRITRTLLEISRATPVVWHMVLCVRMPAQIQMRWTQSVAKALTSCRSMSFSFIHRSQNSWELFQGPCFPSRISPRRQFLDLDLSAS
jgi:hypothetical protein